MQADVTRAGRKPAGDSGVARNALLDAAVELLAERGPNGFSSREVALRASVNYGLIHYYFRTKEQLIRAALVRELREYATAMGDVRGQQAALLTSPPPVRTLRAIVQLAINWDRFGDLQDEFPIAEEQLSRLGADPEVISAIKPALVVSACLQLGWLALGAYLMSASRATAEEQVRIEHFVRETASAIARANPPRVSS